MMLSAQHESAIAVIGLAGRFPGACNIDELWDNLKNGREALISLSDDELRTLGVSDQLLSQPNYVKASMTLEGTDYFDANFFGYNPVQAALLDPQKRLFLECAWEAIENAGYSVDSCGESMGVFAGSGTGRYHFENLRRISQYRNFAERFQAFIDLDKDFLTTQTSYKLNLGGPSVALQTACSTSLVAVHMACQSLLNFECDTALAGGVSLRFAHGHLYVEGGILSPDGHCRAFDADARGTIFGSGAAVVVLKRLVDAIADSDDIWAVIRGSAINNDGSRKVGYTAPGFHGQVRVIAAALAAAGVESRDIGLVEGHGTGTVLGDAVELAALTEVYKSKMRERELCAIGSIKSNIGHLDTAAGIAGLIKAILCLKNQTLVPSLNFEKPNAAIDSPGSPFYVNTKSQPWSLNATTRIAAVSSFGIGGTNAHVIVEEAPRHERMETPSKEYVLPLSARTESAVSAATQNLASFLKARADLPIGDVAYTLQVGRNRFSHRQFIVAEKMQDAADALQRLSHSSSQAYSDRSVVFLFQGLGPQREGMVTNLYRSDEDFRRNMDKCASLFRRFSKVDIIDLACNVKPPNRSSSEHTFVGQLALFSIEYCLAKLWLGWGLQPAAMVGHSLGEYAAACVSQVISLEDAVELVGVRAQVMSNLPPGAMLATYLTENEAIPLLSPSLSIAAINGPNQCVISGAIDKIEALESRLSRLQIPYSRLEFSHAFHSEMMEPASNAIAEVASRVRFNPPTIPYISCLSGRWVTKEEVSDPAYWGAHVRNTVRYSSALRELMRQQDRLLLEVGPGEVLVNLARPQLGPNVAMMKSLEKGSDSDRGCLLRTLGQLWVQGASIDWSRLHAGRQTRRVRLPTYPFERQCCRPPDGAVREDQNSLESHGRVDTTASRQNDQDSARPPQIATPSTDRQPRMASYVAPRNEIERIIVGIWEEALGRDDIGVADNFFELGGNSLIALRVLLRIRDEFHVEVPVGAMIHSKHTVTDLAIKLVSQLAQLEESDWVSEEIAEVGKGSANVWSGQRPSPGVLSPAINDEFIVSVDTAGGREKTVSCWKDDQVGAIRHISLAEREAAEVAVRLNAGGTSREVAGAAIIGSGTMGRGIAMSFADAGIPVTIVGKSRGTLARGLDNIAREYDRIAARGTLRPSEVERRLSLISTVTDLAAVADVDLVVEAVPEEIELKKRIFAKLSQITKCDTILATNTSFLDLNAIARASSRPSAVLGMHFSNPANVMHLVEIVRGTVTTSEALATAVRTGQRLGKVSVIVGVCRGFVGNRMLRARSIEAERMLIEGALPQDIDGALVDFGFPMGPFAVSDFAGLDVSWQMRKAQGLRSQIADALCESGRFGRKSGKGFYRYDAYNDIPLPDPEVEGLIIELSQRLGVSRRVIDRREIVERSMFPLINEGARILKEDIVARSSDIDLIWVHGFGFPVWLGGPMYYADEIGLPYICERLAIYAARSGDTELEPAPLLSRLAEGSRTFGSLANAKAA